SGADGSYSFSTVAGDYTIALVPQNGFNRTAPALGEYAVSVADGQTSNLNDFGVLSVSPGTHAPIFTTTPPASVVAGEKYLYRAFASDDDGDTVTYSIDFAAHPRPGGLVYDTTSGTIGWQTRSNQA